MTTTKINAEVQAEMESRARAVARRYAQRASWAAAREQDLYQTCWLAMLDAWPRFDASRGVPLGGYLWRVAVNAAHRAVHEYGSPVSAKHRMEVLRGHLSTPITPDDDGGLFSDESEAQFTGLARDELRQVVRDRLAYLLGAEDGAPFALATFGEGVTGTEVASAHNVPVKRVWRLQQQMRREIQNDPVLRELWEGMDA